MWGDAVWALSHVSPRCPSILRPAERHWQVPLCRGLADERGPAVRPSSWPGSTVLPCRQCLGWSREAMVMPCVGVMGLAPCTGSPGAAPLTPAMGCEGGGRRGQLICLCQEAAHGRQCCQSVVGTVEPGMLSMPVAAPLACGTAGASTMCQLPRWHWESGPCAHPWDPWGEHSWGSCFT